MSSKFSRSATVQGGLDRSSTVTSTTTAVNSPPGSPILPSSPVLRGDALYSVPAESVEHVDPEVNTAALGLILDPADVLTDRARGWKSLVKSLSHHFDRLADAEKAQAKSHAANAKEWSQPSPVRQLAFTETSSINSLVS
ncbi:hypothetical protein BC830DRAFT_1167976, partial [Chytriomyces sp. MP71]